MKPPINFHRQHGTEEPGAGGIADELEARSARSGGQQKNIAAGRGRGSRKPCWIACCSPARLAGIVADVRKVITLDDPVGAEIDSRVLENGLRLSVAGCHRGHRRHLRERAPMSPIDIASLCLKTSNASILRGGADLPLNLVGAGDPACWRRRPARRRCSIDGRGAGGRVAAPRPLRGRSSPWWRGSSQDDTRENSSIPSSSAGSVSAISSWTRRRSGAFIWRSSETPRVRTLRPATPSIPCWYTRRWRPPCCRNWWL